MLHLDIPNTSLSVPVLPRLVLHSLVDMSGAGQCGFFGLLTHSMGLEIRGMSCEVRTHAYTVASSAQCQMCLLCNGSVW